MGDALLNTSFEVDVKVLLQIATTQNEEDPAEHQLVEKLGESDETVDDSNPSNFRELESKVHDLIENSKRVCFIRLF